jgi:hypothetical protein
MNYVLDNKDYEKCPTTKIKVINILLNTSDCVFNTYKQSYTWHLQEEIRDVVAIRPLRIEFTNPASQGAFLNLNEYRKIVISNPSTAYYSSNVATTPYINNDINVFHRLINGTDIIPQPSDELFTDPYSYVFKPMERRINRFEAKIYSNTYTPLTNTTMIAVLAIYCVDGNCNY